MNKAIQAVAMAITVGTLLAALEARQSPPAAAKPPAPPMAYIPSEIQLLRLQVKQRDAKIAQQDFARAQAQFQAALAALNEAADKIRDENNWPKGVQFNPDTVTFAEAPAAPAPAATSAVAPKPEAKKP